MKMMRRQKGKLKYTKIIQFSGKNPLNLSSDRIRFIEVDLYN